MSAPRLRWIRRGAMILILFAVVDYLVLPQIAGTRQALHLLSSIQPWWVVAGITLEGLSFVSYSLLTRSVLTGDRPAFSWLLRTDLTALGVSHVLPGGAATATTLRYRLLREGGVAGQDAAVGMAVEAVGSTIVLVAMVWVALVASIPLLGGHPFYVTAAAVGAIAIAGALLAVFGHSPQSDPAPPAPRAVTRLLPQRLHVRVERFIDASSEQLHTLLDDRNALRVSATWAAGNWAFDAASLWVFLAAYGHRVNPVGLLVAYGFANLIAVLPISPGGIGVIEGVLIPSLVGFGTPRAAAVLGVISWRLFDFWAPIPAAGVCYLSLQSEGWRERRRHRLRHLHRSH